METEEGIVFRKHSFQTQQNDTIIDSTQEHLNLHLKKELPLMKTIKQQHKYQKQKFLSKLPKRFARTLSRADFAKTEPDAQGFAPLAAQNLRQALLQGQQASLKTETQHNFTKLLSLPKKNPTWQAQHSSSLERVGRSIQAQPSERQFYSVQNETWSINASHNITSTQKQLYNVQRLQDNQRITEKQHRKMQHLETYHKLVRVNQNFKQHNETLSLSLFLDALEVLSALENEQTVFGQELKQFFQIVRHMTVCTNESMIAAAKLLRPDFVGIEYPPYFWLQKVFYKQLQREQSVQNIENLLIREKLKNSCDEYIMLEKNHVKQIDALQDELMKKQKQYKDEKQKILIENESLKLQLCILQDRNSGYQEHIKAYVAEIIKKSQIIREQESEIQRVKVMAVQIEEERLQFESVKQQLEAQLQTLISERNSTQELIKTLTPRPRIDLSPYFDFKPIFYSKHTQEKFEIVRDAVLQRLDNDQQKTKSGKKVLKNGFGSISAIVNKKNILHRSASKGPGASSLIRTRSNASEIVQSMSTKNFVEGVRPRKEPVVAAASGREAFHNLQSAHQDEALSNNLITAFSHNEELGQEEEFSLDRSEVNDSIKTPKSSSQRVVTNLTADSVLSEADQESKNQTTGFVQKYEDQEERYQTSNIGTKHFKTDTDDLSQIQN